MAFILLQNKCRTVNSIHFVSLLSTAAAAFGTAAATAAAHAAVGITYAAAIAAVETYVTVYNINVPQNFATCIKVTANEVVLHCFYYRP